MTQDYNFIGRQESIFNLDLLSNQNKLRDHFFESKNLVIGGAGTIGLATVKTLARYEVGSIVVVDISENNLVEVVRDLRSEAEPIKFELLTFPIDFGSKSFAAFLESHGPFDNVFNLAALKHVRSEKDVFSIQRMLAVNVLYPMELALQLKKNPECRFFCVSTDKAAAPKNVMGASKQIMENFLLSSAKEQHISLARFANVAFSDGSLPYGFTNRFAKHQPFAAPKDIKRYFMLPEEAGEMCILANAIGSSGDIFYPKLISEKDLKTFEEIATLFLENRGFQVLPCESEEEAKSKMHLTVSQKKWPCYFFNTDTTGEKSTEQFHSEIDHLGLIKLQTIGVVQNKKGLPTLDDYFVFKERLTATFNNGKSSKAQLVSLITEILSDFDHVELNKNLDQRM